MEKNARVYVAGHTGLVGSAIVQALSRRGIENIVTRRSQELDLRKQAPVNAFFEQTRPDYVFLAAAHVGGKQANSTFTGEFIYDNLQIQTNVIHGSYKAGVKKLLFFGSNCMYPRDARQPLEEESLLTGPFEPSNEPYAVAKVTGFKMCAAYNRQYRTNFITAIPASQFGPHDNFDLAACHLVPALIRRFHEAKLRGDATFNFATTGNPRREIMYVDDLAEASLFLMDTYQSSEPINVGPGYDLTMREIAECVKEAVGFQGEIIYDSKKKDGIMRKLLDSSKIHGLGWRPSTSIREGIQKTYEWLALNYVTTAVVR